MAKKPTIESLAAALPEVPNILSKQDMDLLDRLYNLQGMYTDHMRSMNRNCRDAEAYVKHARNYKKKALEKQKQMKSILLEIAKAASRINASDRAKLQAKRNKKKKAEAENVENSIGAGHRFEVERS